MKRKKNGRPFGGGGQARVLSLDELQGVIEILKEEADSNPVSAVYCYRDIAMVLFQHVTGLRVGELASLNVSDVLDKKGNMKSEFVLRKENTKCCKARTIYFENETVQKALLLYLEMRSGDLRSIRNEPLFASRKGKKRRFTANGLAKRFVYIYQDICNLEGGATSHSGRRSFGTNLSNNGVGLRVIQELLGHSSLETTQRYLEVTPEVARSAVKTIQL